MHGDVKYNLHILFICVPLFYNCGSFGIVFLKQLYLLTNTNLNDKQRSRSNSFISIVKG